MRMFQTATVKYLIFSFNLIFGISGIAILTVGAIVLANVALFKLFLENQFLAGPIIFIFGGLIIFMIAYIGCLGAICESYKLLIAFAICLVTVLITELSVGITALVFKTNFASAMKINLASSMKNFKLDVATRHGWNNIQTKLRCCGVDSFMDWINIRISPPNSCYDDSRQRMDHGCWETLEEKIKEQAIVIIVVGIGFAFVQITGIVLSCLLANGIKRESRL